MTQHTPGPWDAEVPPSCMLCTRDIRSEDGKTIALVGYRDHANDVFEDVANARLIAAAPDLLEACRALVAYLSPLCEEFLDGSDEHAEAYNACQAAREAIAKATGENLQKTT